MNLKMDDLRVRTRLLGSYLSFHPTINHFVDFLHRLSNGYAALIKKNLQYLSHIWVSSLKKDSKRFLTFVVYSDSSPSLKINA